VQAQTLAKIHHKNLVSLIGYCKDREYMALVYEYMSEGALHEHLRGMQITQIIKLTIFKVMHI
jgi:serine/threonine protein kinase